MPPTITIARRRFLACAWSLFATVFVLVGVAWADSVVVFNEVHYHPWDPAEPEWIELHNQMAIDVDLSDWRLRGGVDFDFPPGTVIPARGYLLLASEPDRFGRRSLGPWSGMLANGGESLRLRNNSGRLMDEMDYGDGGRWPIGADGAGATLAKIDEDSASREPENWRASPQVGGTPGATNFPDGSDAVVETVLVPIDSDWRYNDSGVRLAADWASTGHAVGAGGWQEGPALLGFDINPANLPEPLQTTFADPVTNDIVTYYFETDFFVAASQAAGAETLVLRHIVDDGAVFYLNGEEIAPRFNLPDGPLTADTPSNGVVRNAQYQGPFTFSAEALVPGVNRFAVEVHQESPRSGDVAFGAELRLKQVPGTPGIAPLIISEMAGTNDAEFRIEIANTSATAFEAGGYLLATRGSVDSTYELPEGLLIEGNGLVVLDEETLGFRPGDGDRLFLFSPGREDLIDAARVDDLPRAWSEDHQKMLTPDVPTFGDSNSFAIESDIVINEIMYHFREDPGIEGSDGLVERTELIRVGDQWRYNESGVELPAGWQLSAHPSDGVAWHAGPGLLGFEFGALPEPIRTTFASPTETQIVTYYLEREFDLTAEQLSGSLSLELSHIVDDAAVFYLNGVEVARYNLPAGPISPGTLAASSIRDASWVGPVDLLTDAAVAGTNRLSVELHQDTPGSSDVVFGARLDAVVELAEPREPQPIVERDEEWVELFNKGSAEVDLTGWSIDGGIDYEFPAGTRMAPGDYLVVAKDAAALVEKYPDLAGQIVGDYRNRLNNSRELFRLEDSVENPVDEVYYVEGGRWPSLADGNGSSLELRDPDANNANPAAWAASDETEKQGWQTVTYRGRGDQGYGLTRWNEFRLGMLRAGEVLVDDVSVVRDPDGAAEELIQNGSFTTGSQRWRIIGNHRHSSVISEPGNPGNRVLHLVAKGATDTRHNHLETTFVGNTPINPAEVYEVSFRARWLAGSNQLNSRCYYQRLARTTQLDRPEHCGTPGAPNSRLEPNIGPTVSKLRHEPPVPRATQPITVAAEFADPDGLGAFTLKARYDEEGTQDFDFTVDENGRGQGTLPGAPAGTVIQFWIEAADALGTGSMAPAGGPDSRALIQVEDGQGSQLALQEVRLILLDSDREFLFDRLNLMSNERLGGTVVYNRRKVTYDVKVRLRGSGAGRARDGATYQGFNIAFPEDDLFRGVHDSIGADRSGRSPVVGRPDEIYIKHMFNRAGVPCMYDDLMHLIGPAPTFTGTAIMQMARYGGVFTESQFEDGGDGGVFNLDITYDPISSLGGPEGLKPPVPFQHIGTDFRDLGESKEDYRAPFEIRTGRRRDDYSGLIRFCQTMSASSAELEAEIGDVMNVDEWMRYAALMVLCGIGDTYVNGGLQHNIRVFVPPGGEGVVALPWDSDFVFSAGATSSVLPGGGNFSRVAAIPRYRRLYWGHLQDLVNRTFNAGYMEDWLTHYGEVLGANLGGQLSYIRARGAHALNQLPPEVPFRITTNGGSNFAVNATEAVLEGKGWVNVRELRVAGSDDPLPLDWLDGETWQVRVPLLPGENSLVLDGYDFGGALLGSDSLTITSTVTGPQPVESLRITELHYNPDGEDGSEFLELKNIGSTPLPIGGVQFTDGFDFTVPPGIVLGPGAFALVVREESAFTARYGAGLPVIGQFAPDALSNDGERIELRDASGNIIHEFTYSDAWYPETDGGGHSLVVRDVNASLPTWDGIDGWTISREKGGSPDSDGAGSAPGFGTWQSASFTADQLANSAISGALADANGDGTENLFHYLAGSSPWMPVPAEFLPAVRVADDRLQLLIRRHRDAVDLEVTAQFGNDLEGWSAPIPSSGTPIDHGDGTETLVFEDSVTNSDQRFGRIRVALSSP